ncbi:MAG TPA: 2-oxoglutarate dehydrogenase E1 component [Gemmatimonadaceae bacterium]
MAATPISSVFNDAYVAEQWELFRRDPSLVEESWRQFFRLAESLGGGPSAAADDNLLRVVAGAAGLIDAIRTFGHLAVSADPLGSPAPGAPELTPEFHGITEEELQRVPGSALGQPDPTAADAVARLRRLYASTIGIEFEHVAVAPERNWLRTQIESGRLHARLTPEEETGLLRRLAEVDGLERFLHRAYQGYKRFSIEGTDALVPMLDEIILRSAEQGARQVAIAMAHRGRINVLAHILEKPYAKIFSEFEGMRPGTNPPSGTGDVKYHLGARAARTIAGREVEVTLVPNPSHLEFVNPVLMGVARANQRVAASPGERDESAVVPVCIHGDAAFPGEGIVAETLNMARLRGYRVGGTVHIIVNNQVGFTTDPRDGRSTYHASDLAKGFEVPVIHVNADDPAACVQAVRFALEYRALFGDDILIDLVGYRRYGHNETDEPAFTQPAMYEIVRSHPRAPVVWAQRLTESGVISAEQAQAIEQEAMQRLEQAHEGLGTGESDVEHGSTAPPPEDLQTAVRAEQLIALNEQLLAWPADFKVNPRLSRNLVRRRDAMGEEGGIDWGHAEVLAFASLLVEGVSVRMSGQDAERGTFSHRQAVLHDVESSRTFTPLQHLPQASGWFELYNSPLSEAAVLGFEYGFSTAARDALVLWEAQFGDFVNVAQPIIDQFLAADRAKWDQNSGVVLLLPHGYEGQGPEHSSARLERFLQLCAEGNMVVAYPSTPAQYFHVLRCQALRREHRPLVLMQPKSLLRLPAAASRLADFSNGTFHRTIDDPRGLDRESVTRLVFCTGKLYYDLMAADPGVELAIARVEELYPWPHEEVTRIVDSYPNVVEVVWAQEEPKNMGAWTFVAPHLRVATGDALITRYIGRPERASPAEGYAAAHDAEQERIVQAVLTIPQPAGGRRRGVAART